MQGKEGGHKGTGPEGCAHSSEDPEEEEGIDYMEEEVVEVVSLGVKTVEGAIEHVREPRQGMPVGGVPGGEGPDHPLLR